MNSKIAFFDLDHCLIQGNLIENLCRSILQKGLWSQEDYLSGVLIKFLETLEEGRSLREVLEMIYSLFRGLERKQSEGTC